MPKNNKIITGNTEKDGEKTRGWITGAFIDSEDGLRRNNHVEVKWGQHPIGEERESKASEGIATSLSILISGKIEITFDGNKKTILSEKGDYVMWTPNIPHHTEALENTEIITIRWPSLSSDKN